MFKVIIAGSRSFDNYSLLKDKVSKIISSSISKGVKIQIVSGGCKGADKLGERFAKESNLSLKVFPADWGKHGKAAGPIRNKEMAEYSDALIAFWDNKSTGTKNMIDLANEYDLYVRCLIVSN